MTNDQVYQSPFSWRYGSDAMRAIWSEHNKRILWRKLWVALAEAQQPYNLVTTAQIEELRMHQTEIDIPAALKLEQELHHDLMAELKTFAGQCPSAGGIIHLGATSMDIEDNADALRIRDSLQLLLEMMHSLLMALAEQLDATADLPIMAFTHIQPAEPSTFGYRLAMYAQDLLSDYRSIHQVCDEIKGKGFKGAVGTAASYFDLLGEENYCAFETDLSRRVGVPFFEVSTQTYTRKQDYTVLAALAGLGATLHKMAFDLRILQTPPIGEVGEPFGARQVGSSAMPFKRNPINAEKIDSLARELAVLPQIAWSNAATSLLERTLDDSANRRTMLPEAFLICDEIVRVMTRLVKGMDIRREVIQRNLDKYAPFACTERVMMAAGAKGADRQEMHEILRNHALAAWQSVQTGGANDLVDRMLADPQITCWVSPQEISGLARVDGYIGIAAQRAHGLADTIRTELKG